MAKGYIRNASGWEPFEANPKAVMGSSGWQTSGEFYVLRRMVESPPGTFTPEWEHMATRAPTETPSGCTVESDNPSAALDPVGFICGWSVPSTEPEASYGVLVEIHNADTAEFFQKSAAAGAGSVSWTAAELGDAWRNSHNVYALFYYYNDIGTATASTCAASTNGTCP